MRALHRHHKRCSPDFDNPCCTTAMFAHCGKNIKQSNHTQDSGYVSYPMLSLSLSQVQDPRKNENKKQDTLASIARSSAFRNSRSSLATSISENRWKETKDTILEVHSRNPILPFGFKCVHIS